MAENTLPIEDYQELLQLTVISLSGNIDSFAFQLPGLDYHA